MIESAAADASAPDTRAAILLADARAILEQKFGTAGEHRFFLELVRVEDRLAQARAVGTTL